MADLSPAAQAVMDAYVSEDRAGRLAIAAALRSAADQAMPEFFTLGPVSSKMKGQKIRPGLIRYRLFAKMIRNRLLAIADELDNNSTH